MGLVDNHPHKWPKPLRALEHRSFRLLWLATFASNAGSWMQRVAAAWLVYTMSGSEIWLGIDAVVAGLPALLLLPFAGVLADTVDRRRLLIITNCVNAVLATLLAVLAWSDLLLVPHLLGISFLSGIVTVIGVPSSQSIMPTAAGEDHIPNAVALNSLQYNVARALGPALGGVALAQLGAGWCFVINAISFLTLAGVLTVLASVSQDRKHEKPSRGGLAEIWAFLRSRPELFRTLALVSLLAFGGAPFTTLLPALAKSLLGGAPAYSALLASFGIGGALAGALLAFLQLKDGGIRWIAIAAFTVGLCGGMVAYSTSFGFALGVTTIAGLAFVGAMIGLGTELLSHTPDHFRGRVGAMQQLCFRTAQPLGGLSASMLADYAGLPTAFFVFGVALSVGTICVMCL